MPSGEHDVYGTMQHRGILNHFEPGRVWNPPISSLHQIVLYPPIGPRSVITRIISCL